MRTAVHYLLRRKRRTEKCGLARSPNPAWTVAKYEELRPAGKTRGKSREALENVESFAQCADRG